MADGINIDPGTTTEVATDDCGASGHTQIVKLAVSADGDATVLPATATDGMLVNLGANNDVTVTSGSVTANAGTNLNTSALALESGGNLAGAATSLAIVDDWDESDRAKVNIVAGQAGITAGAGAVGASTPRVTLASDDPAVTALQIIDDWDESDRAKVNIVVGQAGITAGAGAVAASTPRVTLASDDPAVAALQILDNAISGSEMQVDVVGALPAGTNAIGKLAANSGVDIGDVDVTSIIPGTGATNLGKAEDAAHSSGDVGTFILGVRNENASALSDTEGDYTPIAVDRFGSVVISSTWPEDEPWISASWVNMIGAVRNDAGATLTSTDGDISTISVDGAGRLRVAAEKAEDAPHTTGDIGVMALAVRSDSQTVTGADGDYVPLLVNSSGALYVTGGGGGTEYTEDAAAAANPVGGAQILVRADTPGAVTTTDGDNLAQRGNNFGAAYVALTDTGGSPVNPVSASTHDSSIGAAGPTIMLEAADFDGAALPNAVNAEGDAVRGKASLSGIPYMMLVSEDGSTQGTMFTHGVTAHDGVGTSINPILGGALAVAHGSNPAAVAASDLTRILANRHGIPFVIGGHPNVVPREYMATSAQTDDAIITVSSGTKIVVTAIEATTDADTSVDVGVRIGFGAANVPAEPTDGNTVDGVVFSHSGIAAGSGVSRGSGDGIIGIGGDGEDLRITSEAPTGGKLRVLVSYFTIES
jgi:hypothetical protein